VKAIAVLGLEIGVRKQHENPQIHKKQRSIQALAVCYGSGSHSGWDLQTAAIGLMNLAIRLGFRDFRKPWLMSKATDRHRIGGEKKKETRKG
jgi:hypothetical protein